MRMSGSSLIWTRLLQIAIQNRRIPFRVTDRYYGTLAHKIFLHTLKATMHVYAHLWGPKTTCHDALEQVCVGGRVRRGPRRAYGRPSRRRSFGEKKKKKKKNK